MIRLFNCIIGILVFAIILRVYDLGRDYYRIQGAVVAYDTQPVDVNRAIILHQGSSSTFTVTQAASDFPVRLQTPGAVGDDDGKALPSIEQVCTRGFARARRPDWRTRRWRQFGADVYASYGIAIEDWHLYRLDHLVPLELDGLPIGDDGGKWDMRNLWPEPIDSSFVKDRVENALHAAVCYRNGYHGIHMTLAAAQLAIAKNWKRTPVGIPSR